MKYIRTRVHCSGISSCKKTGREDARAAGVWFLADISIGVGIEWGFVANACKRRMQLRRVTTSQCWDRVGNLKAGCRETGEFAAFALIKNDMPEDAQALHFFGGV